MNLDEIRRLIIIAVCSDDFLLDTAALGTSRITLPSWFVNSPS